MNTTTRILSLSALALALAGCGGASDFTPASGASAADTFAAACQECHGEKGAGKFGFLLKIAGSDDEAQEIADHIRDGGMIMPAFPNIDDAQRMELANYVKSL